MGGRLVLDRPRMDDPELDPYATPHCDMADEAPAGTWFVQDGRLLFRHEAVLPEVDLLTGREDVPLVSSTRVFEATSGGRSAWLYVGVMALAVTAVAVRRAVDLNLILAIAGLIAVSYLIGLLVKRSVACGVIHFHMAEQEPSGPNWRRWLQLALATVGIGFFLGTVFTDSLKWMFWGFGVMSSCLVMLVVVRLAPGGLKCTGEHDGWFVLEGIPDEGLRSLAWRQHAVDSYREHE